MQIILQSYNNNLMGKFQDQQRFIYIVWIQMLQICLDVNKQCALFINQVKDILEK